MKKLQYTIEDKAIAELFGRQNFSTKEAAIFELVKNSYDSGSKKCLITINDSQITISDFGKGMNEDDIANNWMHVGRSNKGYKDNDTDRVLAGSKGVGRFAIARLGGYSEVFTKKKNDVSFLWSTDWENTELEEINDLPNQGTSISISMLRENWRNKDIKQLLDFLERAYCDSVMNIVIEHEETSFKILPVLENLEIGKNYVSKINIFYNSKTLILTTKISSDEFENEVKDIASADIEYMESEKDVKKIFEKQLKNGDITIEVLKNLGDFSAELYFSLDIVTKDIKKRFLYKYGTLNERVNTGIILYRNAFSISSLEGKKDWLALSARARKSPAAATHNSGSWRVRANQLSGRVDIDKVENKFLKDLSNRQGLDENEYYETFIKIIDNGIATFERYRQSIIREINDFNKGIEDEEQNKKEYEQIKNFLKKPQSIKKMPPKEIETLATEVADIQKEMKTATQATKETEEKFKYEARILNVLATQGLKASGIAHELHTDRTDLDKGYSMIVSTLKRLNMWEELNSTKNTKIAARNVPDILNRLNKTNQKLKQFLDVMLGRIEKNSFQEPITSIEKSFEKVCENWKSDYASLDIIVTGNEIGNETFMLAEDVFNVIFDNLILNSLQCNPIIEKLVIHINYTIQRDTILFDYRDNGIGLTGIYEEDPLLSLEVHESSREEGHGLGMWIINNSLHYIDGEVLKIFNDNGYRINFMLKGVDISEGNS
ncbi:ATP-binding protein [Vagococcus sp.]|uniref:ATP-binding protein n=1 Tax=Vagococcus sp. TaxID=1933889 RepID=UPI002FC80156